MNPTDCIHLYPTVCGKYRLRSFDEERCRRILIFWIALDSPPFISHPPPFGGHFVDGRQATSKRVQLARGGRHHEILKEPLCPVARIRLPRVDLHARRSRLSRINSSQAPRLFVLSMEQRATAPFLRRRSTQMPK